MSDPIVHCEHCHRIIPGHRVDHNEAVLRQHRSHMGAVVLAKGGHASADGPMGYGCDTGCIGWEYVVVDARGDVIVKEWGFGEQMDEGRLAELADYHQVPILEGPA